MDLIYPQREAGMSHLQDFVDEYLKGKKDLIGIEIGSYAGESTSMFVKSGAFKTLYCIDPWQMGYDPKDCCAYSSIVYAEIFFDYKHFMNPIIKKVKAHSEEVVDRFEDNSIDFIYIDGDHRYEAAKRDLNNYVPKVKPGGIISGHDYVDPNDPHINAKCFERVFGVKKAVDEYFKKPPIKTYLDFSWVQIKK